jgi:hypothetical protein
MAHIGSIRIRPSSCTEFLMSKIIIFATLLLSVVQAQEQRVFARYTGPRGRQRIIRKCAKRVIRDYDDDDVVIIETYNPQCLRLLQQDANILEADMDYPVVGFGLRGGTDSPPRRALDEDVPYRMEMIQADQLEASNHNVLVCIVDTGVTIGHPEFDQASVAIGHPEFDQANIQGTDTVKFYGPEWNWDVT